jgi:hypothetical protein
MPTGNGPRPNPWHAAMRKLNRNAEGYGIINSRRERKSALVSLIPALARRSFASL